MDKSTGILKDKELDEIVERIRKSVEFFANFENQELVEILKASSAKKVKAGELIFNEMDEGKDMYIVVYGSVDINKKGKLLTTVEAGGCFGEIGIIDQSPRTAQAKAKTDTLLMIVNNEILASTNINVRLKLYKNFSLILAKRLRAVDAQLV